MDKRTRVLNAMDKLPVDHVPVGFWFHFDGEETKGEECVQAHLRYYRETDLDFLKIMNDGYSSYPLPDTVKTAKDLWDLKPLGKDHPWIKDQVWRAKRIVEEIGRERCVFYNVFAPFSFIRNGKRNALIMDFLREDKLAVMHALDIVAEDAATLSRLLIQEAGCDGIYYCVQGGEKDRFTIEEYKEIVAPSDLYVLEHANRYSDYNIMHCCGWAGAKNNIELWQDYPVKCVNWAVFVEELPLPEGRAFFGDKAILGGFETLHLDASLGKYKGIMYSGQKKEIEDFTRDTILTFGKRGLMLGGDCTIATWLDHERIKWIVDIARSL
jgi:uroporphyrinogen decarboxylase